MPAMPAQTFNVNGYLPSKLANANTYSLTIYLFAPQTPKINLAEFYWVYIWLITGINKIKLIKKKRIQIFHVTFKNFISIILIQMLIKVKPFSYVKIVYFSGHEFKFE